MRTVSSWDVLTVGAELPEIALEVTEQTVILVPVSTWDLFPGHHSPAYARSQGQPDMYLNTIALQGVADRSVTDHLGPDAWVVRRKLAMVDSVYPGDRLSGAAVVTALHHDEHGAEAAFALEMSTARGLALRAELTVRRVRRTPTAPAGPNEIP